jgi:uncharacterized membrane protein YcaP (DUF421 family)
VPTTMEVIYQSFIAFFFLFVLARLLGKRQIAQLTLFDYIVGITIGNIAASWSLDDVKTRYAIISLLIWSFLSMALAWIQRKSYRGRILLDGRPCVLIQNGNILEENLKKVQMSVEELLLLLRQKDVFKVADVEYAILENNGALSVMKKSEVEPLTPKSMGMFVVEEHEPRIVIIDGHLMERSLAHTGYTKEWLMGELMKQGANRIEDVFLAQIDAKGNVYVDLYHDQVKLPAIQKKMLLAATLKKLQADLEQFALETQNEAAKQSYERMARDLKQLLHEATPYLKE